MKINGIKYSGENNKILEKASNFNIAKEIIIPEGVEEIGISAFDGNKKIEKIILSDSVKIIRDFAFNKCKKLKEIDLNKVEYIGDSAFDFSAIKKLTIPSSVKRISTMSLINMYNLETLVIECDLNIFQVLPGISLGLCPNLKTIYVKDTNINSEFYEQHKDIIIPLNLDALIEQGKSFKEANKIIKEIEQIR